MLHDLHLWAQTYPAFALVAAAVAVPLDVILVTALHWLLRRYPSLAVGVAVFVVIFVSHAMGTGLL